jgi:ribosomal protein L37AE/L43A
MKRKPFLPFGEKEGHKPRHFGGKLKDPALCTHEWNEREIWHQVLKSEGKTIWKCPKCGSITNTYAWHKPE